jgi:hypothetical protein
VGCWFVGPGAEGLGAGRRELEMGSKSDSAFREREALGIASWETRARRGL